MIKMECKNYSKNSGKGNFAKCFIKMKRSLLIILILSITSLSYSGTYYVDPSSGSDSNPGTQQSPWRSISYAEANAANGSTVYLQPGNYGNVSINRSSNNGRQSWDDGIFFTKLPGKERPVLNNLSFSGTVNRYVTLDNVHIDSSDVGMSYNCVYIYSGGYIKISNSEINGPPLTDWEGSSNAYSILMGDYGGPGLNNIIIENNHCHDTARGIMIKGPTYGGMVIRGNHLHDFGASCIKLEGDTHGNTLYIDNNYIHTQRAVDVYDRSESLHGSGLSLRSENITARNNIIRAYAGSTMITTYRYIFPDHGYRNMRFENNLMYDARSRYYVCRFDDVGSNFAFNNNTVTGSHMDSSSGAYYYQNALHLDKYATQCDTSTIEICNNIFVGYVDWPIHTGGISAKGNLIYAYLSGGAWRGQAWIDTYMPGNKVYCTNDSEPAEFRTSGVIFKGGDLFNQYAYYRPNNWYHNVDLGDSFSLAEGSEAIGFAYPEYAPENDIMGALRDSMPDAGAYEFGGEINNKPVADAGDDQVLVLQDGATTTQVTLDASSSSDSDGSIISYTWLENSSQIATGQTPTVELAKGEHSITLEVTDDLGATATDTVLVTVEEPDLEPPVVVSATAGLNNVDITFNEELDQNSAEDVNNYSIDNGITVSSAVLSSDMKKVKLTTSDHTSEFAYILSIQNVKDLSGNAIEYAPVDYTYDNKLLACWLFDDPNDTVAEDSTENNNDGTLIGGTEWTAGKYGSALSFDGTDDCVDAGSKLTLAEPNSVTFTAWIKPDTYGGNGWGRIMDNGDGTNGCSFYLAETVNGLSYVVYGAASIRSNSNVITTGQWQHVAVVHDKENSKVNFYVNGQTAGSTNYTNTGTEASLANFLIGMRGYDLSRAFDGDIDDVRVYGKALTQAEVQKVYEGVIPFAFTPIGDKSVNEGQYLQFNVETSSPDIDVYIQDHNLPSEPNFVDNVFNWFATFNDAGKYTATFVAPNGQVEDFETINITVNNINRSPVISSVSDISCYEKESVSFTVDAVDPDGDTVSIDCSPMPAGATFADQTFNWTPTNEQAGTYTLTLTATDGQLEDTDDVTIDVLNTNNPPQISSVSDQQVAEGSQLSFSVSATDPDGDSTAITAANLPAGSSFSNNTFTWTPDYNQAGNYNVTFTASDGELTSSTTVSISVSNVNRDPVFDPVSDQTVDAEKTLNFNIYATDPDGDSISITCPDLPAGAAFDGTTFSWTPSSDQTGQYAVTFYANDGESTVSSTVNITVNESSTTPAPSDLLGYWKFDENSGITAYDSSNYGNNGSLINGTAWDTGSNGSSVKFDGSNDYVNCGNDTSLNPSESITISAWIKVDSETPAAYPRIVDKGNGSSGFSFYIDDKLNALKYVVYGQKALRSKNNVINSGSWQHVALVYNSSAQQVDFYVDGINAGTTYNYSPTPYDSSNSDFIIGMRGFDNARNFRGHIDEVSIYNRPLTSTEINNLFEESDNAAPTFDPIEDQEVYAGQELNFNVNATDADGDALTYSASNLPAGATFENNTFTWTPTSDQTGTHSTTFTVSDGQTTTETTVSITVLQQSQTTSLMGYWDFDSSLSDMSGNNNDGTIYGTDLSSALNNGNLSLDGTDDYVNCGNNVTSTDMNKITISAWIRPDSFGSTGWPRIVDQGNGSTGFSFYLDQNKESLKFVVYGEKTVESQRNVVNLGTWQHVAVTYDSSSQAINFYLNGNNIGSSTYSAIPADTSQSPFLIGMRGYDTKRNFDGMLDEVRIYNEALSASDITSLAQN